jgi:hypothetical protein
MMHGQTNTKHNLKFNMLICIRRNVHIPGFESKLLGNAQLQLLSWDVRLYRVLNAYRHFGGTTPSKALATIYQSSRRNIQEDFNIHQLRCENFKVRQRLPQLKHGLKFSVLRNVNFMQFG